MNKLRLIYASAKAASLSIVVAVFMTIYSELSVGFKNALKSFSGHHWTTKSIVTIALYVVALLIFFFIYKTPSDMQVKKSVRRLIIYAMLGAFAILGFFIWHYLA